MTIQTEIRIHATPAAVWKVLTDFPQYPVWNPFIKSLTGTVQPGNTIKVALPGMTFTPKVLVYDSGKELRWLGRLFLPGIFDGEHYFQLKDNQDGTTTFYHGEQFKGLLVPLFRSKLNKETKSGFEEMNRKLKERVENTIIQ